MVRRLHLLPEMLMLPTKVHLRNTNIGLVRAHAERLGRGWACAPFECGNATAVPPEGHRRHASVLKGAWVRA